MKLGEVVQLSLLWEMPIHMVEARIASMKVRVMMYLTLTTASKEKRVVAIFLCSSLHNESLFSESKGVDQNDAPMANSIPCINLLALMQGMRDPIVVCLTGHRAWLCIIIKPCVALRHLKADAALDL
jgi:hypothetical protein